jgi:hypothetical protein
MLRRDVKVMIKFQLQSLRCYAVLIQLVKNGLAFTVTILIYFVHNTCGKTYRTEFEIRVYEEICERLSEIRG